MTNENMRWHPDLTEEQIDWLISEKEIYEPKGQEYIQALMEMGLDLNKQYELDNEVATVATEVPTGDTTGDNIPEETQEELDNEVATAATEVPTGDTTGDNIPEETQEELDNEVSTVATEVSTGDTTGDNIPEETQEELDNEVATAATGDTTGDSSEETPIEETEEENQNEEEVETEQTQDNAVPIELEQEDKEANKSNNKMSTKAKIVIGVAGAFLLLGSYGVPILIGCGWAAYKGIQKLKKKWKLKKEGIGEKITDFKTEESKEIEEYNKKLESSIAQLLAKPNNDYELEIAILKYENAIELLKARMEVKRNELRKKGNITKIKLQLKALEKQSERAEKTLAQLRQYKSKANSISPKSKELSQLNAELIGYETELKREDLTQARINELSIMRAKALQKRNKIAGKLLLDRDGIARKKAVAVAYEIKKEKVKTQVSTPEIQEEEQVQEETTRRVK